MKITHYEFGHIEIDGIDYRSDVIVSNESVQDNWRRKEGHVLGIQDLDKVLLAEPDVIIIGSGYYARMDVPRETLEYLENMGVRLEIAKTSDAIELFNELQKSYSRIVAALHLTC